METCQFQPPAKPFSPLTPTEYSDYGSTFTPARFRSLDTYLHAILYLFPSMSMRPYPQWSISGHLTDSSTLPLLYPTRSGDVTQYHPPQPSYQSAPHSCPTIPAFGISSHVVQLQRLMSSITK